MSRQGRARLDNLLFHILLFTLVGLSAWLSHQHRAVFDWTASARNSLGAASRELLAAIDDPIELEVFIGPNPDARAALARLIERFQRHKADIRLSLVDPQQQPGRARELGIRGDGEMLIRLGEREERLQQIDEQSISNALRRLARGRDRWLAFIEGHGERSPGGNANHDLGQFAARLEARGARPRLINLIATPQLPTNLDGLIIAGPQSAYLPGELAIVQRYLRDGGNLLLLLDPQATQPVDSLLDELGVAAAPGVVVDANARRFNIDDPAFALVNDYPAEHITPGFNLVSLLPLAVALEADPASGWQVWPVLRTGIDSWTETGPLQGEIRHDADQGELRGPLNLGLALTRRLGEREQRVLVIGDGDFIANAYLGNGGNLELGLTLIDWLSGDRDAIPPDSRTALDREIRLPDSMLMGLALVALLGLPLALLTTGLVLWRRRRNRV